MHVFINNNSNSKVTLCVRVSNYRAVKFYVGRFNGVIKYVVRNYYENGDDAYFIVIEGKCCCGGED
ncbi:Subunit of the major N alpha-acetyltransferase [Trachipleistophora hominis]|uniref:Subunit of the major N alpha-acetyltransferase n=1 Tax=Trachipleistophora hominis TaxID=72359 RepID=L7JZY5_TRAHO|nr:Subunit of the major N alpha-acetyltransferase [Trachipleistophora hominis]